MIRVPIYCDECREIVDAVSWREDAPGRWWQETGMADLCGYPALRTSYVLEVPCPIWRLPATWAAHNEHGVCVLDWNSARFALWDVVLVPEDPAHMDEIERRMRPQGIYRPRFLLRPPAREAA